MYLIVEFEGEGTTGPAAKSWYADGYSWWPPYKDLDRLLKSVRTMEAPQPEKGWTRHRARILHESASFQNVANNWKKASYTSDINSEPEIAGKRIPKKKTSTDHIYSSEDEAAEQAPIKKRKAANKASVPPAPKPPAIPKLKKKACVNQQQWDTEDQQQTWCESLPSFQAPLRMSQPDHDGDGWCAAHPNTQEHTFAVLRPSGDHQGRGQTPVGVSQAEHHGDGWSAHPPDTQEHTFSVLRPSGAHQGRTLTPVGVSQAEHHGDGWSAHPPDTQAVERAILETLEKMDMRINHLTSLVQSLVGNRRIVPQMQMAEEEEGGVFPLASTADLDRLEQRLADRGFMQRMVNRLSISGGPSMKKTVWRICSKVFSTDVARQLNWCGRGDKRGIRKTHIGALLIASAMRNPVLLSPTEADAEKFIKDFLRLAPGRI
ncbi:uncharacterized protein LOC132142394 isoform X2 [Carassius carassius]|uniref:uncharacterized protein LOC132142394 isoform X2 n=1 Tax=Carassius carassius TaxID=217509 RepID=UPI00286890DA|nr:uncharacterized protein LOC132142394 isoform X2 [Carassius carassius]